MKFSRLPGVLALAFLLVGSVRSADTGGYAPTETWLYKKVGDTELRLHAFLPAGHRATDRRPAIVFFFGGGWTGGAPGQFYPHSAYLASRGMVAIAAEYRIKTKHGTSPKECVMDGKSALRWVREHAREHGIDPEKIAAGGGSAGGHVAAAAATVPGLNEPGENTAIECRPVALVLFNPVFDNGPDGGWGHETVKGYWQEISPAHNLSAKTPPTVVFVGSEDKLIPLATVQRFKQRMEANGRRCDTHIYAGQGHGFFNYKNPEYYAKTVIEMDRFLASLGLLAGEPTLKPGSTK